jgi:hypothetical protein
MIEELIKNIRLLSSGHKLLTSQQKVFITEDWGGSAKAVKRKSSPDLLCQSKKLLPTYLSKSGSAFGSCSRMAKSLKST